MPIWEWVSDQCLQVLLGLLRPARHLSLFKICIPTTVNGMLEKPMKILICVSKEVRLWKLLPWVPAPYPPEQIVTTGGSSSAILGDSPSYWRRSRGSGSEPHNSWTTDNLKLAPRNYADWWAKLAHRDIQDSPLAFTFRETRNYPQGNGER